MAWGWSHSAEAHEAARYNLGRKPRRWLEVCLAEIQADQCEEIAKKIEDETFDWSTVYKGVLKTLRSRKNRIESEWIADDIWTFAEEQRTCDNGGSDAWMCPHGCHTVSFSNRELDRERGIK